MSHATRTGKLDLRPFPVISNIYIALQKSPAGGVAFYDYHYSHVSAAACNYYYGRPRSRPVFCKSRDHGRPAHAGCVRKQFDEFINMQISLAPSPLVQCNYRIGGVRLFVRMKFSLALFPRPDTLISRNTSRGFRSPNRKTARATILLCQ